MANRSYLYSTNRIPGPAADGAGRRIRCVGEYRSGIPYLYKLLLSGSPRTCRSAIWDKAEDIALIGEYELGMSRLQAFLARIESPAAAGLVAATRAFFAVPERRQPYFLLECGEIFDMNGPDLAAQNCALLDEVRAAPDSLAALAQQLDRALARGPARPSLLTRLLGQAPSDRALHDRHLAPLHEAGLGSWSEILYFDFPDEG